MKLGFWKRWNTSISNMSWKLMDFIFCARLCVFALKSCEFLSQALCKKQNLPSQSCGLIRFCVPSNSQITSTKQITRTENPTPQVACCGPRARYSNGHWCWSWDPPGSALPPRKCGESVSGRCATPWKPNPPLMFGSLFFHLSEAIFDLWCMMIMIVTFYVDFARFAMICNKYSRYYIHTDRVWYSMVSSKKCVKDMVTWSCHQITMGTFQMRLVAQIQRSVPWKDWRLFFP